MIHTDEKNLEKSETIVLLTAHEIITSRSIPIHKSIICSFQQQKIISTESIENS